MHIKSKVMATLCISISAVTWNHNECVNIWFESLNEVVLIGVSVIKTLYEISFNLTYIKLIMSKDKRLEKLHNSRFATNYQAFGLFKKNVLI